MHNEDRKQVQRISFTTVFLSWCWFCRWCHTLHCNPLCSVRPCPSRTTTWCPHRHHHKWTAVRIPSKREVCVLRAQNPTGKKFFMWGHQQDDLKTQCDCDSVRVTELPLTMPWDMSEFCEKWSHSGSVTTHPVGISQTSSTHVYGIALDKQVHVLLQTCFCGSPPFAFVIKEKFTWEKYSQFGSG